MYQRVRKNWRKGKNVKLKAVVTEGTPEPVVEAIGSQVFATRFLTEVATDILGAKAALSRPAEYYVQIPDRSIFTGKNAGVELRLSGVSRNGRSAKQFHTALAKLHEIAKEMISNALSSDFNSGLCIQLFTVLMLDGDIETAPGSGEYSNVLEHPAELVEAKTTENPPNEKSHGR
jgi:hypothetical protein